MHSSFAKLSITLSVFALGGAATAILAQSSTSSGLPVVNEAPRDIGRCGDADLTAMRGSRMAVLSCTCPKDNYISGDIWGSGPYTDDSHICTAAYHAGALRRGSGGVATLQLTGPQDGFPESERNGLESRSWGGYDGSFRFVEYREGAALSPAQARAPRDIGRCADANLTTMRGEVGALLSCTCPADNYFSGDIWGSGPYTDDSHICTAAYHAGALRRGAGGKAVFTLTGPQDGFPLSERNGLESRAWGAYEGSFTFED